MKKLTKPLIAGFLLFFFPSFLLLSSPFDFFPFRILEKKKRIRKEKTKRKNERKNERKEPTSYGRTPRPGCCRHVFLRRKA